MIQGRKKGARSSCRHLFSLHCFFSPRERAMARDGGSEISSILGGCAKIGLTTSKKLAQGVLGVNIRPIGALGSHHPPSEIELRSAPRRARSTAPGAAALSQMSCASAPAQLIFAQKPGLFRKKWVAQRHSARTQRPRLPHRVAENGLRPSRRRTSLRP
jgi:hypothetical protein